MSEDKQSKSGGIGEMFRRVSAYLAHLVDLREDTDKEGTIDAVIKYTEVRGYNVWILMCSAMIASIGLDMNSQAVIIGAMLISPLMSPILGIGLSIGINDREFLARAFYNFAVAVIVTLLTSFLYFYFTPLGAPTEQLLTRTEPTLLDVFVALFGGIAGIVAASHKDKTNALPGVAIATALMPPLCTAGFGLAKFNTVIFGGAIYLFFINAVIIAASTYLIVRYLKFPLKEYINPAEKRKTTFLITVLVVAFTIPSIFILRDTLREIAFNYNVSQFIKEELNSNSHEVLDWKIVERDSVDVIKFFLMGESLPEDSITSLKKEMLTYNELQGYDLDLIQMDVSQRDKTQMRSEITEQVMQIVEVTKKELDNKISQITDSLTKAQVQQAKLDSINIPIDIITKELQALYPELETIQAGRMQAFAELKFVAVIDTVEGKAVKKDSVAVVKPQLAPITVSLNWQDKLRDKTITDYNGRIERFLKTRFDYDTLIVEGRK